jgi:hypothetical protein
VVEVVPLLSLVRLPVVLILEVTAAAVLLEVVAIRAAFTRITVPIASGFIGKKVSMIGKVHDKNPKKRKKRQIAIE